MNISTEGGALVESVVSDRLLLASATAAIVIVAYVLQGLLKTDPLASFPIVGKGGRAARRKAFVGGKGRDLYIEGYRKVRTDHFLMIKVFSSGTNMTGISSKMASFGSRRLEVRELCDGMQTKKWSNTEPI